MLRFGVAGLLLLSVMATVQAGVYKWVDENGNVQYSDNPQDANQAQSVPMQKNPQPDPETLKRNESRQQYLDARSKEREQAQADKEKAAKEAAQNKQLCDNAKNRLAALQIGGRLVRTNPNGERSFLSDEERQAEIAAMKSEIAKNCK